MVRLANYAKNLDKRGNQQYYRWRVFIDEPDSILDQISEVKYILHPTFPEPQQVQTNRGDKFALETSGWGSFTMLIEVTSKGGKVEMIPYFLDLGKDWPSDD